MEVTYMVMEINNLEPLKIGSNGNKVNQVEPCKDYIPGSTIRGAIINILIKNGIFNEDTKYSILENLECYNAYPYVNDILYTPTPINLRVNKHDWRFCKINRKEKICLCDAFNDSSINNDSSVKNYLEYPLVAAVDNKKLKGISINKEYKFHHNKFKSRENIFRYQAISEGYKFRGIIKIVMNSNSSFKIDKNLQEQIQKSFANELKLYIGGSKGSGYGLCSLRCVGAKQSYKDIKSVLGLNENKNENVNPDDELKIFCLSDCLFRDEYGILINYIPIEYFKNEFGKVELESKIIQSTVTEGFNSKWRARYPKEITVKAGSVFVYRLEEKFEHEILLKKIEKFESTLLGMRKQDGFGWIDVNTQYPMEFYFHNDEDKSQDVLLQNENYNKNSNYSIIVKGFQNVKKNWLLAIYLKESESDNDKNIIISDEVKSSQLENMENLIRKYIEKDCKNEKQQFIERNYHRDNRKFSICSVNFMDIYNFLNGDKCENANIGRLKDYAKNKLNSSKGRLFYESSNNEEYKIRHFISDLMSVSLYNARRRRKSA